VTFVEVYLSNWDSHGKPEADAALGLMTQVDDGLSALVTDLKERGCWRRRSSSGWAEFGTHAEDQQQGRPRSLVEGLEQRAGRRRHQGRPDDRQERTEMALR